MSSNIRKCIYTGEIASAKDSVVPRKALGNELHNWAGKAPVSKEYKDWKKDRMPSEDEMELNRLFHKLELAKLDVVYLETKIQKLQEKTIKEFEKRPKKIKKETKKDKEIKQAIAEKEAIEISDKAINQVIKNRKNMWS